MKIVVLAGGVGAARFLDGLVRVIDPAGITAIVNTGDDEDFYGLRVCPDIDTILYTLSGDGNERQGWGRKDETFAVIKELEVLGEESWFMIGDRDFATHIHRSNLLKQGQTLTGITADLAERFSVPITLLPMSDERIRTLVTTPDGAIPFQEYFVKRHFADKAISIRFAGVEKAKPTPSVLIAIRQADAIIVAPSNPIVSIGTILAVPGIRQAVRDSDATKIAISPIIAGRAIKGPAGRMMDELGMGSSAYGVAKYYWDLLNFFVIDRQDAGLETDIKELGISVVVADTIMKDTAAKKALAKTVIDSLPL